VKQDPRVVDAIRKATTDELDQIVGPFFNEALLMLDVQSQRTREDVQAEAHAVRAAMGTPTRTLCLEAARQVFLAGETIDADSQPAVAGQLGLRLAALAVVMDQLAKHDDAEGSR